MKKSISQNIKELLSVYIEEYDLYKFAKDMNELSPKDRINALKIMGDLMTKLNDDDSCHVEDKNKSKNSKSWI
jgi:hypothetical protein